MTTAFSFETSESRDIIRSPLTSSNSSSDDHETTSADNTMSAMYRTTTTSHDANVPRITLRKRTVSREREVLNLTTVNSAFLSGLFADVAQVQEVESEEQPPMETHSNKQVSLASEDPRLEDTMPCKKSRISMTRSISRCGKSFKVLEEALTIDVTSPVGVFDFPNSMAAQTSDSIEREDSLFFQLNCVSAADGVACPNTITDVAKLAFPHLPATVSNTSCSSSLTRSTSDLHSALAETSQQESYGWFVEMDDDDDHLRDPAEVYAPSSSANLAFSAATAPKAVNYDEELEWAKAADTVDDVLGDFF